VAISTRPSSSPCEEKDWARRFQRPRRRAPGTLPERARQPENAFQKLPFLSISFREVSFFKGLRAISAEKFFLAPSFRPNRRSRRPLVSPARQRFLTSGRSGLFNPDRVPLIPLPSVNRKMRLSQLPLDLGRRASCVATRSVLGEERRAQRLRRHKTLRGLVEWGLGTYIEQIGQIGKKLFSSRETPCRPPCDPGQTNASALMPRIRA